jgi:hypothetical protein
MQWAATARERGHPLYLWHGPRIEVYTVESVVLQDDDGRQRLCAATQI